MKVLLKHDVPKLGKAGQVKNVADGSGWIMINGLS